MEWYLAVLSKYAQFSGRSRRKEYWFFVLFNFLISFALGIVDRVLGLGGESFGLLGALYGLAVFIPGLAVSVRRLHDTGKSGWWILIGLVPILGWIALIVFMASEGTPGTNEYGADPKLGEVGHESMAMG